jgi:hypothetical protein
MIPVRGMGRTLEVTSLARQGACASAPELLATTFSRTPRVAMLHCVHSQLKICLAYVLRMSCRGYVCRIIHTPVKLWLESVSERMGCCCKCTFRHPQGAWHDNCHVWDDFPAGVLAHGRGTT